MKYRLFYFLFLIFLTACGSVTPTPLFGIDAETVTLTPEPAPPPTAIIAPTFSFDPSPTPNLHLLPENWQEWPIVPAVTEHAKEIYLQGLANGNNPHAFSKVGDCQNIKGAFMGYFDRPDRYNLGPDFQYLQETIDNFKGYFDTDGQAVKGGFNAATVLSPLWANPNFCLAGENPLECELRISKPSIVFISFEVWWEGRTAEEYEEYMRQIIEVVISHRAVPILATKADNIEGDHSINLTTARLAYEYDLPLWNFWLAVQPLDYHGIDPGRDDGFHISTDGWKFRSFTGLQTLDSIWRGLRDLGEAASPVTVTPITTKSGAANMLATPASGPSLADSGEQLIFGIAARQNNGYRPDGVCLFDFTTQTSAQVLGPDWDFQVASPDGQILLVNQGSSLYLTDGLTLTLLTNEFYSYGQAGALYMPDGSLVYIVQKEGGTALAQVQADGTGMIILTSPGEEPIELYQSTDGVHLTWESGSCSSYHICDRQGAWLTDLKTDQSHYLDSINHPLVSPDGTLLAYETMIGENESDLAFASIEGVPSRTFPIYGDILAAFTWQPHGSWLAIHMDIRSDYSGRVTDGANFLVNAQTSSSRLLSSALLLNPALIWSSDGRSLAWLGTDWVENRYVISLLDVDVESGQAIDLTSNLGISKSNYIFVTNATWLTDPK